MGQAGLHEALLRIDLGVMPWHSWPFLLGSCHSTPGVTSVHSQHNTVSSTVVIKNYLCLSLFLKFPSFSHF